MDNKSENSTFVDDPIYEQISKIPQEIKAQVEMIAQEMWKEERINVIQDIAKILDIQPEELESQLRNIRPKRGRPRKKV